MGAFRVAYERKGLTATTVSLIALALVFISFAPAKAQTAATGTQVHITWRTIDGSAPSGYPGKVLPKIGSQMIAAVEVLTASGQRADLSGRTIYWYLDDELIGSGIGKQSITFTAPGHIETMSLRVTIPSYPNGGLINTARIRMVNPQIIIIAPYPNKNFAGNSVELQAFPYFFAAAELSTLNYQWVINGQTVTAQENPLDLIINLNGTTPKGYSLAVDLGVQASNDPYTGARSSITLTKSDAANP